MRFFEIALNESQMDHIISDITDFIKMKKNNNVKSIDFDLFYELVKDRNSGISRDILRDILETLPMIQNVSADKIEFKGEVPDDMLDQDGVEDMADKVSDMADQEAMKGVKAELYMATYSSKSDIFLNATEARKKTRDSVTILNEVRALEANVLTQVNAGNLEVTVSSGTTITNGTTYYQAYNNISTNTTLTDQISTVKKYFTDKGYSVNISTNAGTGNTLQWKIKW